MTLLRLTQRNILIYIRNRSTVFYSLMSMLIIIALMALFLGDANRDNVIDLLNQYGGPRDAAADSAGAKQLILLWTLAGVISVNSVTITLMMIGHMVEDEDQQRLSSFYVSPVNRAVLVMGYILGAVFMGIVMCLLTLAAGEVLVWLSGGTVLTLASFIQVLFYIILNVFMSSSMMFFIINFVHSHSAFSGLSTIIGTLVGFLSAIYLPMGELPVNIQKVLKCFPLLHGSSMMREVLTKEVLAETFKNCPAERTEEFMNYMGITINWGNQAVSSQIKVAFMLISGIILILVSALIQRKRITVIR